MIDLTDNQMSEPGQAVTPDQAPDHFVGEDEMAASKSSKSPAFQFYPKDYLSSSKVQRMSLTERGAYTTLLAHDWLDNGLMNDMAVLARLVGMPTARFARMWQASPLHECFPECPDGRLRNPRLQKERRVQADYRRKQKENAGKRWQSHGNATALPDRHSGGNAPLSLPQSAIRYPQSAETRGAPIHDTSHKKHAHCGRVCLHASLFGEFVRRRNHPGADTEIRDWAMEIEQEWAEKPEETGDPFDFWRARYAEKWPAATAPAKPKWGTWRPAEAR